MKAPPGKTSKAPGKARTRVALNPQEVLMARLSTLPEERVGRVPPHAEERAEHHRALLRHAVEDQDGLCTVPLEGGRLTPEDLGLFGSALKLATDLGNQVGADRLSLGGLKPEERSLLEGVRLAQGLLLSAFRRLRFRGRTQELRRLRAIEQGTFDDLSDALSDSAALIALADHDEHRAWVASLPRGEAEAVATLKAAQPQLTALAERAGQASAAKARVDTLRRAWSVAEELEKRLRAAGQYLFAGQSREKLYRAFKRPKVRKPAKQRTPA